MKIREVLKNQYIGAVAIGVIVAFAIISFIGTVFQATILYWEARHRASSVFSPSAQFPWGNLLAGLAPVVLYLIVAYLLMRWIYYRPEAPAERKSAAVQQPDPPATDTAQS
jgi:H+/Cl- antiporter ClcA